MSRVVRRTTEAFGAIREGVRLGMLDRERLAKIDEAHYSTLVEREGDTEYSYTDDAWNLSGLKPWEAAAIDAHFTPGTRVIVTAAGAGREVIALLDRGFDVVGYEPHPGLVEAGSSLLARLGRPAALHQSPRDAFPEAADAEGIVVGWASYTLIPGRARRLAFLRAARAHVAPGSPLLVSVFHRHRTRSARLGARIGTTMRKLRGEEPVEVGDGLSPNFAHWFTVDELVDELRAGGFEPVEFALEPDAHAVARAT